MRSARVAASRATRGTRTGSTYTFLVNNDDKDISISRAVGRFFGHLWGASTKPVKKDGSESQRHEVNRETQEAEGEIDGKKVVLRRTTVEEVEFKNES